MHDVFICECSNAAATANRIVEIRRGLKFSVQTGAADFVPGRSILKEIARVNKECAAGLFLFTTDDPLEGRNGLAAPRDNVVFEAGYFMSKRGPDRTLIILEEGAKLPADLQGNIFVELNDRNDVSSVRRRLESWLDGIGGPRNRSRS
jgi:predicted nucleotide-binding protein